MSDTQKWFWLTLTIVSGALLYLLAPVLTPFLAAALIAYMGDPLVDRLERWRLSRTWAVVVVFSGLSLLVLVLLLILLPLLERQFAVLLAKLPGYLSWVQQHALPWLQANLGLGPLPDLEALREYAAGHWQSAGGVLAKVLSSVSRSGLNLLGALANLLLIPVVAFYLLRDWDVLMGHLRILLPRHMEPEAVKLAGSFDEVLGAFFRGQLLVMLALGVIYSLGLWLVGLDLALLIGMLAGVVSFVPYLGFIVGIVAAGIAALMQFQEFMPLVYVLLVFGVAQLIEGMVLTPLLLGERIGLHPVAVIFAVLAGGQLFGFFGILLALPVAAVVVVLLRYSRQRYLDSRLYSAANRG